MVQGILYNEKQEYKRIKKFIYKASLIEDDILRDEIRHFGDSCTDKRLYKSLKYKYLWHRKYNPRHIPIGKPRMEWVEQQKPLVSVIVPNYCHAPYLKERIDCILNQTFQNFELILLDDCSTDNSKDIIMSYKDNPKVSHIIINEKNTGNTFCQWEKGVSLAKGKYIWMAESDDYADETFLDSVMAMFCLHKDCVLVRTGSYQVNERGRVLLDDYDVWKEDESIHYYDGLEYIRHNMLHFNFIYNASMVVFRKDVFQTIDKSYQQLHYTGDWLCWIEMLLHGSICEYRRKLNYFRQHKNKVSFRSGISGKGVIDQIRVLAYTLKNLKVSPWRRAYILGEYHNMVVRTPFADEEDRKMAFEILYKNLHVKRSDILFYKIVKPFSFLPFVPSTKNDKLK